LVVVVGIIVIGEAGQFKMVGEHILTHQYGGGGGGSVLGYRRRDIFALYA
jgi:hypothetical protein